MGLLDGFFFPTLACLWCIPRRGVFCFVYITFSKIVIFGLKTNGSVFFLWRYLRRFGQIWSYWGIVGQLIMISTVTIILFWFQNVTFHKSRIDTKRQTQISLPPPPHPPFFLQFFKYNILYVKIFRFNNYRRLYTRVYNVIIAEIAQLVATSDRAGYTLQ